MSRRNHAGFLRPGYDPLKVPNAPTIGTATNTMAGETVSVTFTAPSNAGGSAITAYYAVATDSSTGAQFTATGTTSPVSITGLTNGNSYTVKVYAVNSYGPSAYSSNSGSVTPTSLAIGDAFGGGFYAGKIAVGGGGVATHYLIVAPKASGDSLKTWGPTGVTTGYTSVINGPTNSAGLATLGATYQAATFCEGLTIGGYTDWYLPAKNELEVLYYFLKPVTDPNNYTFSGSNANAVSPEPISTNYIVGSPAQTSATAFRTGNSEAVVGAYWSSTENVSNNAWFQDFGNGAQSSDVKNATYHVRAVRRIPV